MLASIGVVSVVVFLLCGLLLLYVREVRLKYTMRETLQTTIQKHLGEEIYLTELPKGFVQSRIADHLLRLRRVVREYANERFLNDFECEEVLLAMQAVTNALCNSILASAGYLRPNEVESFRAFLLGSKVLKEISPFSEFDEDMWERWNYVARGPIYRISRGGSPSLRIHDEDCA